MKKVLMLLFLLLSVAAFSDTKKYSVMDELPISNTKARRRSGYKGTVKAVYPQGKGYIIKIDDYEFYFENGLESSSLFYSYKYSNTKEYAICECKIINAYGNSFEIERKEVDTVSDLDFVYKDISHQ